MRINISVQTIPDGLWRRFAGLDMPRLIPHFGTAGHIYGIETLKTWREQWCAWIYLEGDPEAGAASDGWTISGEIWKHMVRCGQRWRQWSTRASVQDRRREKVLQVRRYRVFNPPGIFRLSSHWLPTWVTSAASFWRVIRSVRRPDGSPPIFTRNGLPGIVITDNGQKLNPDNNNRQNNIKWQHSLCQIVMHFERITHTQCCEPYVSVCIV